MSDFKGQRVLITAGAAGLGRVTAEAFADVGARVHVCDVDEVALDALSMQHPDIGCTLADVSEPGHVEMLFSQLRSRLGGLDILVNNAGIAGPTAAMELVEFEAWSRTLAVNLDGTFLCTKLAVPMLKEQGHGCVVNISSSAGLMGYPLRTPYCAAKWAVVGFTKTLAMELGPFGVRANAICPGPLQGERMQRVIAAEASSKGLPEEDVHESYTRGISMRTFIEPGEVAAMILFLCSEAGRKVTGQVISVDGHTETLNPYIAPRRGPAVA